MKSVRGMSNMLKGLSGASSPRNKRSAEEDQRVEDDCACDQRVQSLMSGQTARGVAKGDRVSALAVSSTSSPRVRVRSCSFDPSTMAPPTVTLSVLDASAPPSHANEWLDDKSAARRRRNTLPSSPHNQEAIEKCIAAIEECKTALARSSIEDDSSNAQRHDDDRLRASQAQGGSPRHCSLPTAGQSSVGSARASRASASKEDMAWLDDTTGGCEPSTCPTPRWPSPDVAFAKSSLQAPDAFATPTNE
ncbi:hypothetical protein T484DRAFT_1895690 [Baffinella frigidus]|nr:hypothetical protein T484DRAFT_1895690 [Cryptophyta sp. CCMP2293]